MGSQFDFLFVNKHATSTKLTQSQGLERSAIFRHAQQSRSDHSREIRRLSESSSFSNTAVSNANASRLSECKNLVRRRKSGPKTLDGETPVKRLSPPPASPTFPLYRNVSGNPSPFNTDKISLTPRVHHLLRIYNSDVASLLFPIEPVAVPLRHYTLSLAMEDYLMHYSLLGFVSTRMYNSTRNDVCRVSAMAFKHRALGYVRRLMASATRERVNLSHCYAISMLIWIECLIGSYEDLKAHASGLQYLMHRVHDTCNSPAYVLRIIYGCAYLCAALLHIPPPIKPTPQISEPHLSLAANAVIRASQNPTYKGNGHSFFQPSSLEVLGPFLTPIARRCQNVALVRDMLAADERKPADADMRYIVLSEISVEHDLLAMPFENALEPHQDAIRLALFINSSLPLVAATGPSAAVSRDLAKQIRRNMEQDDLALKCRTCMDIKLWVLVVGAFVSRAEVEWPWFACRIFALIDELALESMLDLETTLRGCHYCKYLQGTVQALWDEYDSRMMPLAVEALLAELPSSLPAS